MNALIKLKRIEPTIFFIRENDKLKQIVKLIIVNEKEPAEATLRLMLNMETYETKIGKIEIGEKEYEVKIPDIREPVEVEFMLFVNGDLQDKMCLTWNPTRHWKIYVIQESHHDLGYTDLPQHVFEEQNKFLDKVLDLCEETSDWPEESKFRYTIEQSWSILNFIKERPEKSVKRLVKLAKEGRIEVSALYGNEISDMCGHEELIRLLYPSFKLKREYGIPIKYAEITDVPGFSWALATVLALSLIHI